MSETVPDEAFRTARKSVTHALAELEVYFEHAKMNDGAPMWRVPFLSSDDEEGDPVEVRIAFAKDWLVVQASGIGTPSMTELVHAQRAVALARVVDADDGLVAQAEIAMSDIRPANVARAIDSVINLVVRCRPRAQPPT